MNGSDVAAIGPTEAGIRGWLLAFLLWLGLISPLWTLGFTAFIGFWLELKNPTDAALMRETGWDVVLWVVTILRAGTRVAAALLMYFRRVPSSVWFAFVVLWFSGPLLILGAWVVVEGELSTIGLVRSAVVALGLSIFLFVSRRVRVTYSFRSDA